MTRLVPSPMPERAMAAATLSGPASRRPGPASEASGARISSPPAPVPRPGRPRRGELLAPVNVRGAGDVARGERRRAGPVRAPADVEDPEVVPAQLVRQPLRRGDQLRPRGGAP